MINNVESKVFPAHTCANPKFIEPPFPTILLTRRPFLQHKTHEQHKQRRRETKEKASTTPYYDKPTKCDTLVRTLSQLPKTRLRNARSRCSKVSSTLGESGSICEDDIVLDDVLDSDPEDVVRCNVHSTIKFNNTIEERKKVFFLSSSSDYRGGTGTVPASALSAALRAAPRTPAWEKKKTASVANTRRR